MPSTRKGRRSARAELAALAGSSALLACACAPGAAGTTAAGPAFDAQACAEDALRRSPDAAHLANVAFGLSRWCAMGDAASCSMLGVMHELGLGVRRRRDHAWSLYRRACDAGNARACQNLYELVRSSVTGTPMPDHAPRWSSYAAE